MCLMGVLNSCFESVSKNQSSQKSSLGPYIRQLPDNADPWLFSRKILNQLPTAATGRGPNTATTASDKQARQ